MMGESIYKNNGYIYIYENMFINNSRVRISNGFDENFQARSVNLHFHRRDLEKGTTPRTSARICSSCICSIGYCMAAYTQRSAARYGKFSPAIRILKQIATIDK